jgi:hypothetical protein
VTAETFHPERVRASTDADREAAFAVMVARTEPYFAAVQEAGDLPWFDHPEKRAAAIERLELTGDVEPMELRRALFDRRCTRHKTYTETPADRTAA